MPERTVPSRLQLAGLAAAMLLLARVAVPAETPATETVTASLEEIWRISGDEESLIGGVTDLEVGADGSVYILDSRLSTVHVYSSSGEHLRDIGREGDGPGEFRNGQDLLITPSGLIGVLMAMPGRIILLSPDGEPRGDLPLPVNEDGSPLVLQSARYRGDNLVVYRFVRTFGEQFVDQRIFLQKVEPDGKAGVIYAEMSVRDEPNRMVVDETERGPVLQRWAMGDDGSVWLAEGYTDYRIRVWDADGEPLRTIARPYEPLHRSADKIRTMRERIERSTRNWPVPAEIRVNDFEMSVQGFRVLPDGSCRVLTSRGLYGAGPGRLAVYDDFDPDGRFRRRIALPGEGDPDTDRRFFRKGDLYLVRTGGDSDSLEVVRYRLTIP